MGDGGERVTRRFSALELNAEGGLDEVALRLSGSARDGWTISRHGATHLSLGPGYRLLRTAACGVCSTDLDRTFLPFPLPQVIGHELIARDERGDRFVVEINASHRARGETTPCAFCDAGLANHCPDRLVVGIHDLPGGFGPWVLAPVEAVVAVPDGIANDVAVLVEPFAAALHGVARIAPRAGERIAVLGTGRLGLLAVAALAATRRAGGARFHITAWSRRPALRARALDLGADSATAPPQHDRAPAADVVIDTTGSAAGFDLALALAGREVHLKSTHGRPSGGLARTTELVVDELELRAMPTARAALAEHLRRLALTPDARPLVAWLSETAPPAALDRTADVVVGRSANTLLREVGRRRDRLPRFDVAVVDRAAQVDEVVRPDASRETSLVRPRGGIWLAPALRDDETSAALRAVGRRGIAITTSRCGDFRAALAAMASDEALRTGLAGLVTHRLPTSRLARAFDLARAPESIKVVVEHEDAGPA